jgi:glycosyltransferase involved in cell wall biosynthesis
MDTPRFSIVIPTRNRTKTVVSTIRTCLNQDFDNYEIIVSDNCSTPETREAVSSLTSPKIHYFRSDKPLSLSNSWEFAVSHAKGEYVTLLGDDDGLLFHALSYADHLIRELGTKVLRWDYVLYNWSDSLDLASRNLIRVWINGANEMVNIEEVLPRILYEKQIHWALPMIYNSFVHQDLLTELRKSTGSVFLPVAPDACSGFALAYLLQSYPSLRSPLSICGISGSSLGTSEVRGAKDHPSIVDIYENVIHDRVVPANLFPYVRRSQSAVFLNAFDCTKSALFPTDSRFLLDRRRAVTTVLSDLESSYSMEEGEWEKSIKAIRGVASNDAALAAWIEDKISNLKRSQSKSPPIPEAGPGFTGNMLCLDGRDFQVSDVYAVADLYERIFHLRGKKVVWNSSGGGKSSGGEHSSLKALAKNVMRDVIPPGMWRVAQKVRGRFNNGWAS